MRLQDMTIRVSSIMVIFLLLNLPFVFATEINLFLGTGTRTFSFSQDSFISREILVEGDRVFINITPRQGCLIERILLFPCRGLNPLECIREQPVEYEAYSDTYISLDDLVENSQGGILTLVKLNSSSWIGFWDYYDRGAFKSQDLPSLDLQVNMDLGEAESQISQGMIPLNWVEGSDFQGLDLYQIEAEQDPYRDTLNFTSTLDSPNLTQARGYLFVFPRAARVYNPLTFHYQPPVECGNYLCETGESSFTCCQDCGCPENQTCSRTGCIPASDIGLILESQEPSLLECYIYEGECVFQDLLKLKLRIENPPLNNWLNDYFFTLEDKDYRSMACLPEGEGLECTLLLPSMNRSQGFLEKKPLSLYLSMGFMDRSEARTEEMSLGIDLDIQGLDLGQELDLQSYQDKLAQMTKTMEKINAILKFVTTLFNIYSAWQAWSFMQGSTHTALSAEYLAKSKACAAQCPTGCCALAGGLYALSADHALLAKFFFIRAEVFLTMMVQAQIVMMIIQALLTEWAKYTTRQLEDRLKQDIERIGRDTMTIVGDDVLGIVPLLVWAHGSSSGQYTETVCNGEDVEVWYDFTVLNCSGGLWLTPEGMLKKEANITGEILLFNTTADQLFPSNRDTMTMGVECNSTRYYNLVSDIFPFLNHTRSCEEALE